MGGQIVQSVPASGINEATFNARAMPLHDCSDWDQ